MDAIDAVMPAADADRQPCEAAQAAVEAVTELDELLRGDSGLADAYRVAFTLLGGLPTIVRLSLSTNAVLKAVGLREGANKALKELAKNSEIKTSLIFYFYLLCFSYFDAFFQRNCCTNVDHLPSHLTVAEKNYPLATKDQNHTRNSIPPFLNVDTASNKHHEHAWTAAWMAAWTATFRFPFQLSLSNLSFQNSFRKEMDQTK